MRKTYHKNHRARNTPSPCPSCQKKQLVLVSTEWEDRPQQLWPEHWIAGYFECQWCGEEFRLQFGQPFEKL